MMMQKINPRGTWSCCVRLSHTVASVRSFGFGGLVTTVSVLCCVCIAGMAFQAVIDELRGDIERTTDLLRNLVMQLLVSNEHRVVVEMFPDADEQQRVEQEEQSRLESVKSRMADGTGLPSISQVVQETSQLKGLQHKEDSADAKATIPRLSLADLDDTAPNRYDTTVSNPSGMCVDGDSVSAAAAQDSPTGTTTAASCFSLITTVVPQSNSIVYVNVAFDVQMLTVEEIKLLPLFCDLMLDSGTDTGLDRSAVMRMRDGATGGISLGPHVTSAGSQKGYVVPAADEAAMWLVLRGKALESQVDSLLRICQLLLLHAKLDDRSRALEFLRDRKAALETGVPSRGHAYANKRMLGHFSLRGALDELLHGVESYYHTAQLLKQLQVSQDGDSDDDDDDDDDDNNKAVDSPDSTDSKRADAAWHATLRSLRSMRRKILLQQAWSASVGGRGALARRVAAVGSTRDALDAATQKLQTFMRALGLAAPQMFGEQTAETVQASSPPQRVAVETTTNSAWTTWFQGFREDTPALEVLVVPTQVNYVGLGLQFARQGEVRVCVHRFDSFSTRVFVRSSSICLLSSSLSDSGSLFVRSRGRALVRLYVVHACMHAFVRRYCRLPKGNFWW